MPDRAGQIEVFLSATPWHNRVRVALAGDASARAYQRLVAEGGDQSFILMDADPDLGQDIRPFVAITDYLRQQGLSAPRIIAQDTENGFLLLEDLGDALFARVLETSPEQEAGLYQAAVDVLLTLHRQAPPQTIDAYSPELMCHLTEPFFDWYVERSDLKDKFAALMCPLLDNVLNFKGVLTLRDYHAENLIWLPERDDLMRVGLLDYQDAVICHPAYDLVSLLRDARRDVSPQTRQAMITHYIQQSGADNAAFRHACAVLGIQRNLRILFIFARLSLGYGKPHYVDLIPRVWGHVVEDLNHPGLEHLQAFLLDNLPEPNPAFLQDLKDRCNTRPIH